jgi:hypothetical protein
MTPKWMGTLVRARQSQEDLARQRHANARRAAERARLRAGGEAARIDVLQESPTAEDAAAFVASLVARQAAAATHAWALGQAEHADRWAEVRAGDMTAAAVRRRIAEELHDRALQADARAAAEHAQRELDEAAAVVARRAGRPDEPARTEP